MAAVVVLYKFAFFLIFFRSRRSGRCSGVESTLVRDSVKIDIRLLTETKNDDDEFLLLSIRLWKKKKKKNQSSLFWRDRSMSRHVKHDFVS